MLRRKLTVAIAAAYLSLLFPSAARPQAIRMEAPPLPLLPPSPMVSVEAMPAIAPEVLIEPPDLMWAEAERGERREFRQSYTLNPGARVELSDIRGPIEIETGESNVAEVRITTTFWGGAESIEPSIEQRPAALSIRGKAQGAAARDFGGVRQHVRLRLPRRVDLAISRASESVRVGELEGTVRLDGVSGSVGVAQAVGGAEVRRVSGSVTMYLTRVGGRGVQVSDVSGRVTLRFVGDLNANLETKDVQGKVYVDVPNVSVEGEVSRTDVRARIGAGGAPITITGIRGNVSLTRGLSVAELLEQLKAPNGSAARMETWRDLSLHAGNRQVRLAFLEALAGEQNNVVQMTAARALAPYAEETPVRDGLLRALEKHPNNVVRMTAARALVEHAAADAAVVREAMLRVLQSEKNNVVRANIVGALSQRVDEPGVTRALLAALKNDESDTVRARSARALSPKVGHAEVYEQLLASAKADPKRHVRVLALDALSARIKERTELRELFLGYLDDESTVLQAHALRGLVELGDASLKPRLIEKSKEIINAMKNQRWYGEFILDAILLLRKLDPQEADRMLDQLGNAVNRSY